MTKFRLDAISSCQIFMITALHFRGHWFIEITTIAMDTLRSPLEDLADHHQMNRHRLLWVRGTALRRTFAQRGPGNGPGRRHGTPDRGRGPVGAGRRPARSEWPSLWARTKSTSLA